MAIKILPAALHEPSERLARLSAQARLLAALNHPHIGAIYGARRQPTALQALVLELVEGDTLRREDRARTYPDQRGARHCAPAG